MTDTKKQPTETPTDSASTTPKHAARLQDSIEKGLKEIHENEIIAEFSFQRDEPKKEKEGLQFIFAGVEESNNRAYPKIEIRPLKFSKPLATWTAKWALATGDDNINFMFRELGGSWTFFKKDATNEEEEGFGYAMQSELPGFKPLVDEHFISFWFRHEDTDTKSKAPEIKMLPAKDQYDFKKYFWDKLKVNNSKFIVEPFVEDPLKGSSDTAKALAYFITGLLCWRFFMVCCSGSSAESEIEKSPAKSKMAKLLSGSKGKTNSKSIVESIYKNLPALKEYRPKRPVDISPQRVYEEIFNQNLRVPWHVVASATAALNAGKHIIFTGPPGCGKTHVAFIIATYVSKKSPLMSTASQAWSADEIIGRYMPASDGKRLIFKWGFFLKALDTERWLIIDEINRCDIDNCFGELFTVLSGQSVTLPFEDAPDTGSDDSEGTGKNQPLPVRIVVGNDESTASEDLNCTPIRFSEKFRLLATMNDSDVAGLNQLSYALRRRFAIIRIDAPDDDVKKKIFENHIEKVSNDLDLGTLIYMQHNETRVPFIDLIKKNIFKLFARDKKKEKGHEDLIDLRIVGIAPVLDIIRFVGCREAHFLT